MYKRIYSCIAIFISILVISCTQDEDMHAPYTYTALVDVSNASLLGDKYKMTLKFSTDNGSTFEDYPVLKKGQTYKVKVLNSNSGEELLNSTFYEFDWSGSDPQPTSTTSDVAEFTLGEKNLINVKITDTHCPTNTAAFADGSGWLGDEGTVKHTVDGVAKASFAGSVDLSNFILDSSDPSKVWMTNIFGDGQNQKAYMQFATSTNYFDQAITIPAQVTAEGGTYEGTGTYDQCRETLILDVTYTFDTEVYAWTYTFVRGEFCAYNAASWPGSWKGAEGTNTRTCGANFAGSTDVNAITADGSVANRFHMDNWWGDGVDVYFDMNPATNFWYQTITLPAQTTSEGGTIAASTGTFDQCAGTFKITCNYTIGGCTYKWTYNFVKG